MVRMSGNVQEVSKGGYNKILQKLRESNAENLRLQSEIIERDRRIAEMRPPIAPGTEDPLGKKDKQESKLAKFWSSNAFWGVTSVLVALGISPHSMKLIYGVMWAALCLEFFRIKIVERRKTRYVINSGFAAALASVFFLAWPYLPKPKEEPDLDQKLTKLGDALTEKISHLAPGSNSQPSPNGPSPQHGLPAPFLTLEPPVQPKTDNTGAFPLELLNRGPDVEDIGWTLDPFVARKVRGQLTMLVVGTFTETPDPSKAPLRTNQGAPISVSFAPVQLSVYQQVKRQYPALMGVRVTLSFRRYQDQRQFQIKRVYAFGPPGVIYAPGTALDQGLSHSPYGSNDSISLSEVNALIDANERWVPAAVNVRPDGTVTLVN
jgi:hypothetical protein